jgi:hypothetical protein
VRRILIGAVSVRAVMGRVEGWFSKRAELYLPILEAVEAFCFSGGGRKSAAVCCLWPAIGLLGSCDWPPSCTSGMMLVGCTPGSLPVTIEHSRRKCSL